MFRQSLQLALFVKRHRGDSNPCGQSPMDFESISLAARTQCLDKLFVYCDAMQLPRNCSRAHLVAEYATRTSAIKKWDTQGKFDFSHVWIIASVISCEAQSRQRRLNPALGVPLQVRPARGSEFCLEHVEQAPARPSERQEIARRGQRFGRCNCLAGGPRQFQPVLRARDPRKSFALRARNGTIIGALGPQIYNTPLPKLHTEGRVATAPSSARTAVPC